MKRGTTECILKLNSILRGEKNPFSQVKSWKVHKADLRCLEFFNFIHGFISPSLKTTWQSTILLLIYNSPQHLSRTGWDCAGPFHVSPVSFSLHKDPVRKYNYYLPHLTGRETEAQRLHWPQVTSALNDISIFAALLVKEEPETEFKEECQQSHCLIFISKSRSVNSQCKMGLQTE